MNKTFIIAELSANHNHDKQVALTLFVRQSGAVRMP